MTNKEKSRKTTSKLNSAPATVKPLDNPDIKMPADIRKAVRSRQRKSIEDEKAIQELYEIRVATCEEQASREKILTRMAKKIGVHKELMELAALDKKRASRWQKARKMLQSKGPQRREVL